jgi:hypothetical protein
MLDNDFGLPVEPDEFSTGEDEVRRFSEFDVCVLLNNLAENLGLMKDEIEKSIVITQPNGQKVLANSPRNLEHILIMGLQYTKKIAFQFCDFIDACDELVGEKNYHRSTSQETLQGPFCSMIFADKYILIKSPVATKSQTLHRQCAFWPLYEQFFAKATEAFADSNFPKENGVRHYIWVVYPEDNPPKDFRLIDPDNVDTKVIGDPLMRMLKIDDNIKNVSLHIDRLFSDALEPGMYTVLTPAEGPIWTPELAKEWIESVSKKHNF